MSDAFGIGDGERLGRPRWDGRRGRLEAWYATMTDVETGAGLWLHHEMLAGLDGHVRAHGWAAVFPPDAPPRVERFGPEPVLEAVAGQDAWFDAAGARVTPDRLTGRTASMSWDLGYRDEAPPLYPFPVYVWERRLLPSSQIVPWPTLVASGSLTIDGRRHQLRGARGALSRIYGHGNAHRWAWLHADLGGGDVLEVVAAQARLPALRVLPPKVFARLRIDGVDWPTDPAVVAATTRARLDLPAWYATITTTARRLRVAVRVPPDASVTLDYEDPDGSRARCTNSCRSHAEVQLERRVGARWRPERRWSLTGTAHAEVGDRP